jgi:hypothetical protein
VTVDDLSVGDEVEMVVDTLYAEDDQEFMVWKWQPVAGVGAGAMAQAKAKAGEG